MEDIKDIFIIDIPSCTIGQWISITGIVTRKKDFGRLHLGAWVKDITGTTLSIFDTEATSRTFKLENIRVNNRIRLTGQVTINSRDERIISNISQIEVLGTLKSDLAELSKLDSEMREQASRMLMSRICRKVSNFLQNNKFTEFESRVISNHWNEDGLEPLRVLYPGFGSPATLTTSPAAQVIEFLTTTLSPRAYTVSTSFTSSYRFPNGSAETRVIVAKAMNLSLDEHEILISDITAKILHEVNMPIPSISKLNGKWPNEIDGIDYLEKELSCDLNLVTFSANMPIIGKNWNTCINTIIQLFDKDKNILAEGSREHLGDNIVISSFTIYPSQFLGLIEKSPRRQLENLERLYDGNKL